MDQCSKHDTPPALCADLTNRPGRSLQLELKAQNRPVLAGRRLGDSITQESDAVQTH
jgi:hypothetical protein